MDMLLTELSGILLGKEQSFLRLLGLRATYAELAACVQSTSVGRRTQIKKRKVRFGRTR